MKKAICCLLLVLCCRAAKSQAPSALAFVFSDGMVLDYRSPRLFGAVSPSAKVSVTLQNKTLQATADASGKWVAALPAQAPSLTPTDIEIAVAASKTVLKGVLFGDVYLCGGQVSGLPVSTAAHQIQYDLWFSLCGCRAGNPTTSQTWRFR